MLLSLPVELGYCRARAAAVAARLWWLPVGGGEGLGPVDLVTVVEVAVVLMPPASHDRAARTPRMKTVSSLIEGGRAIVRSVKGRMITMQVSLTVELGHCWALAAAAVARRRLGGGWAAAGGGWAGWAALRRRS